MIRPASLADIPWLMEVADHAYAAGTYDDEACRKYWCSIIENPACLLLRGENALMGAAVVGLPYLSDYKVGITLPVASLGDAASELLSMTEKLLQWADDQGAHHFDFSAVTGVDLGPLAKRFGGVPVSPTYRVNFNHVRST